MRVLVACEYSGIVRDAFIAAGHDAMSCDLLPTESPGPHYQGDVNDIIEWGWDLMIAHPPCTYLCNSGVSWLHKDITRWAKLIDGAMFFRKMIEAPIKRICVENPIQHKYARRIITHTHTHKLCSHGSSDTVKLKQQRYGSKTCRRLDRPTLLRAESRDYTSSPLVLTGGNSDQQHIRVLPQLWRSSGAVSVHQEVDGDHDN